MKKREKNEVEFLRGLVRKQKSELRNLKKQLSRSQKREQQHIEIEEEAVEHDFELVPDYPKTKHRCPECKNALEIADLGLRELHVCEGCGYRRSFRK